MGKIKEFLCILLFLFLFPIVAYAKDGIYLEIDKTDLNAGDEVVVTASVLEDVSLYALTATLNYDASVFEKIDENDFVLSNENVSITYSDTTNKFGILNKTGEISGELFQIHLTVKNDANVGETNIVFTNITSSDGENKENYDKASIQVLVTRDAKEGEAIPNHQVFDADDKEETVLKTISTMPFSVGITVLIFLLILYILFQLKTNHPNKKKKVMNALRVILVLLLALMILFFIGHKRRDINNDGETTYEDTQEIIKYLIEMEGTPSPEEETKGQVAALLPSKKNNSNKNNSNNKNKYDVNNDGKVDINDAGASAEHVTEEVHYTVKLSEKGNSYYLEKGSITLEFYASVNPKETIKEVKVDGTYYPVEQEGEYYRVLLEETTAGVHTFKLTDVRLSNTREVHTNLSITKEILKDIPGFTNVNIHEKEKNIEFELVDQDHAFINGAAYIYDGETKIAEEEVREITTIQFDLTTDKMYRIVVLGNYDLDSDPNNAANLYEDKELFVHTFLVGGNYNFTFSNLLLTDTIEHQELPKLTFTSTNTKATSVEKVNLTVDGHEKDYIISKMDHNDYEVELTDANLTIGKHTVQINRFVMKTLKQFVNEQDFILPEMTYEVLKDAPKVENIKLQEHSYTETRKNDKNEDVEVVIKGVNVQFDLKDQDNAVSNMTIALVDSTNKIVATKEFSKEEYNTYAHTKEPIFLQYADKNSSNNNYGAFTVEFLADYTLGDRHNFTNKSIGKQDFYPNTGVKITKIDFVDQDGKAITDENKKAQAKYATKGQKKYRIQFEVETEGINSYSRMSGVTINGLNYTLEGGAKAIPDETDPDNKKLKFQYISNTAFTVPNEAGIVDVKANRIQFENNGYYVKQNDYYAIPEKSIQFEVLKDIPTIKNLEVQEENPLAKTVTFTFTVTSEDGAFKSGKVQLGNETIEITNEELEHKSVTFHNVEPNQMYDLLFEATYDLDSNLLDKERNLNEKIDDKIYQVKYGMFDNSVYETIAIKNGSAISEDGDIYFEKMEPIKLFFTIDDLPENLNLIPQRVLVDGKEYELIKTKEGYTILLDGYTTFGEKELTITNIIFNNGKNVTLNTPYRIRPVVLKDRVKIENYSYEIGEKDLVIKFDTLDYDSSLIGKAKVTVQDEEGTILYTGTDYENNLVTFPKKENVLRYYISIIGNYDRDTNVTVDSDNYVSNETLLREIISLEKNAIELKDIFDVKLYKTIKDKDQEQIILMDEVDIEDLKNHKEQYFVEVSMENLPSIHARIKTISEEKNHLLLELEYDCTINEGREETKELKIEFGEITDGIAKNESHPDTSFKALLEDLEKNKDVTLTHDYDASYYNTEGKTYVLNEYSGKLDGNGYTIKNLDKPLFNKIKKGEVKDLVLKDITLGIEEHGGLANSADNAKIENVLVDHLTKTGVKDNSDGKNGGLLGEAISNTEVKNCGARDVLINGGGSQQNAGLIGYANNLKVENSYTTGKVDVWNNFSAGFIGNVQNSTIKNSYAKVTVNGPISCDFACSYANNQITYENNISLGTGGNKGFANAYKKIENNYHFVNTLAKDIQEGIIDITKEEVNADLFTRAHFDPTIWRLENIQYDNTPILKNEKITELYDTNNVNFEEEKVNLYNNLMKLMPYYDGERILEIAKNVQDANLLHNQIVNIVPVEANGKLVTYLTSDNVKKISKIKIIYKDRTKVEYDVLYDNTYDLVASYRIPDLKIDYNFKNYILDTNSQIENNLTNYLMKLDYTNNLDTLTSTVDSRLYRDFYNETTRKDLREFVLKFLSNSNFASTTNDQTINNYLEREVKQDKKIEKVLYMYNYFKRFYSLDIDGLDISDFMLFNLSDFDSSLTPLKIAELFLQDGNNFSTGNTNNKYISVLSGYTKLNNIADLLEYLVTGLSNHKMDEWVSSQFKGHLVEIAVSNHPEVQYTLWDHLSTPDKGKGDTSYTVYNYILPILTLPKNAAYIISTPVQFIIGAQRSYIENPDDIYEQSILQRRIASYATRMADYFDTAYKILQDETLFNNIHTYQIDKRYAYDTNGALVYQQQLVTEEPFHKNFSEAVGRWNTSDGNAAVAYGDRIEWNAEGLMDGYIDPVLAKELGKELQEYTYHTWSHESAHNIDARLFLGDNGRRFDAGGEDYADSNLMQSFGINDIVMNLSVHYPKNTQIGSNWDPERINTTTKIQDFYSKVFQTIYVMDYLEAQAFLQLNADEKAVTGIVVSYPNMNKQFELVPNTTNQYTGKTYIEDEFAQYRAYQTTQWEQKDSEYWEKLTLTSIDDLVDHKIMLYPGVYKLATRGSNSYGGEGLNTVHWYQPNNPYGRPDSYALKWNAYEMLGYAGYKDGYIEYNSNIHSTKKEIYKNLSKPSEGKSTVDYKTDTMALKKITGFEDYDTYKKHRFAEVKDKLKYLNSAINANLYVQKFYDALVLDAQNMKINVENRLKNNPNCLKEYWCSRYLANDRGYPESTKVRQEIYYKLKEITDDFRGEIYSTTVQQQIGDFQVKKTESKVDEER